MGQSNSYHPQMAELIRQWSPIKNNPILFIHRTTQKMLQCYFIEIPQPNILRQVNQYNLRMKAISPYISRVAYFSQIQGIEPSNLKPSKKFAIYTDSLYSMRDNQWTFARFIHTLQAIFTLTNLYGFFKLTQKMISTNERGQTKIWISENPANNNRDSALNSEEQALAGFAGIAVKKNYEVANLLIGCKTFNQAMKILIKNRHKIVNSFNNLSHRTQDKNQNQIKNLDSFQLQQNQKHAIKISQYSDLSFVLSRKPQLNRHSNYRKTQNALSGRSISQYTKVHKRQKINSQTNQDFFKKGRPQSHNFKQKSFDKFSKTFNFKEENKNSIKNTFATIHNPKTIFFTPKPQAESQNAPKDITIINHNVNHVVNNITHNHSHISKPSIWSNFKNDKNVNLNQTQNNTSSFPFHKKPIPPAFIQQRANKSFYVKPKKYPEINEFSKTFYPTNINKSTQQSFKGTETNLHDEHQRNSKRLYTFSQLGNHNNASSGFSHSHFPQNISKKSEQTDKSFYKRSTKTKTIYINQEIPNNQSTSIQHHKNIFFPQQQRRIFEFQERKKDDQIKRNCKPAKQISQFIETSKSIPINEQNERDDNVNLKRQLKLQFASLLQNQTEKQIKASLKQIECAETPTQNNLKKKIRQKQMAFAQLKKQANAVLTDFF